MNNKIKTYLGFCLKSGKLKIGLNNLEELKKKVFLIIVNEKLGENSFKKIIKHADKFSCKILLTREDLSEYVNKDCMVIAIQDKNLASAILDNLDDGFIIYGRD